MMHKIRSIKTKDNLVIEATFFDGTVKEYNVRNMFPFYPLMKELENNNILFNGVQIDSGGYGISWNDDLDLESETIWEEGVEIRKENTNPILELASKFTEARGISGLTQKQLSESVGIYQADISKIERGIGNPSITTLQRLADGMGMNIKIDFVPKEAVN